MAEIAVALSAVSLLRDSVMTMISEEANLLGGVRAEVQGMESELRGMLTLLTTGEASRDKEWVDEVRELAYDTQDCIDIYRLRIAAESKENGSIGFLDKALHFLKTLPRRRQIAKEIQAIKAKVDRLHNIRSRYETQPGLSTGQDSLQRRNDARLAAPCVDEDQLVGMEERKNKLMQLLLGEHRKLTVICKLTVISVVGIGGLGKTTVAWKLFEDERVKDIFPYRAWIGVSQQSDPRVHLVHLITQLFDQGHEIVPQGLSFMTELQLKSKLQQFLRNKKYMIILDDVREVGVWKRIASAFPNSKHGSRVMVTTQLQNISDAIGSCGYHHEKYPLPVLRDDEAWRLFCRTAFPAGFGCPPHLDDVAQRIVGRCDGLPLAIVTLGGLLANMPQTPNEWDRLHDSLIPELQRSNRSTGVEYILSLGYDDLPAHLKPCFLCFGAFPMIKQTRLMRIWMAEGFVRSVEGRTREEVAMDYLKELADRSMVQVLGPLGRTKFCGVHGFMHEILKSKCKDQNFCSLLHEEPGGTPPANRNNNQHGPASPEPKSRKIRRLSVRGSSSQYQSMASLLRRTKLRRTNCGARLRSLMIAITAPTPILSTFPDISYKLVMLRVLDLEGTNVSRLSDRIASCRLLKYLSLRNTNLDSLPKSLDKLLNLETLDLRGTRIGSLPAEVINLHRLRHLLVPCPTSSSATSMDATHAAWYELAARPSVRVPPGVGQLRDLVKLALFDIGHGDGVVGELRNLTQLRKLGVRCIRREDGEQLCAAIKKMSYLRSLVLHSVGTDEPLDLQSLSSPPGLEHLFLAGPLGKLPTWAQSLHSVVKIVLMGSRLEEDLFDAFQGLPNLTLLSLTEAFAGRHLCSSSGGFKQLEILHLCMLNRLESVTVAEGAMPALRYLSIWYCGALEQVPSGIEHLSSLKELHLLGMHDEFVGKLSNKGTDRGKVKRIPIIRSSTLMKSQGDDWSRWIDDDLKCDIAAEMEEEEEEEEENDDGRICSGREQGQGH